MARCFCVQSMHSPRLPSVDNAVEGPKGEVGLAHDKGWSRFSFVELARMAQQDSGKNLKGVEDRRVAHFPTKRNKGRANYPPRLSGRERMASTGTSRQDSSNSLLLHVRACNGIMISLQSVVIHMMPSPQQAVTSPHDTCDVSTRRKPVEEL